MNRPFAYLAVLLIVVSLPASAAITFVITPAIYDTPPGGIPDSTCQNGTLHCVIVSANLASDADFLLTDLQISGFFPSTTDLTLNTNFFFVWGPGFISAGDNFTVPLFEIDVADTAAYGLFSSTATLSYKTDLASVNTFITTSDFTIQVVPEPGTLGLAAVGVGALALIQRRRKDDPRIRC
jgi:MYXO-CTERM domain-containing protein